MPAQHCAVAESASVRQCWAAEVAAQACDRANNGIREGVSICSWQWQVPSVLLDVLGDGLSDLTSTVHQNIRDLSDAFSFKGSERFV